MDNPGFESPPMPDKPYRGCTCHWDISMGFHTNDSGMPSRISVIWDLLYRSKACLLHGDGVKLPAADS